jgi:hypothetical protein
VWDAEAGDLPEKNKAPGHLAKTTTSCANPNLSTLLETFRFSSSHIQTGKLHNGWVLGSQSELLFWVPPTHRIGLWAPRNTAIMGRHTTRLDFHHFVHGKDWQQCKVSDV